MLIFSKSHKINYLHKKISSKYPHEYPHLAKYPHFFPLQLDIFYLYKGGAQIFKISRYGLNFGFCFATLRSGKSRHIVPPDHGLPDV